MRNYHKQCGPQANILITPQTWNGLMECYINCKDNFDSFRFPAQDLCMYLQKWPHTTRNEDEDSGVWRYQLCWSQKCSISEPLPFPQPYFKCYVWKKGGLWPYICRWHSTQHYPRDRWTIQSGCLPIKTGVVIFGVEILSDILWLV